jgi:hypothetical protein
MKTHDSPSREAPLSQVSYIIGATEPLGNLLQRRDHPLWELELVD